MAKNDVTPSRNVPGQISEAKKLRTSFKKKPAAYTINWFF